ncbi:MAG: NHL repeat-containing protein [Pirellulales bacterium]
MTSYAIRASAVDLDFDFNSGLAPDFEAFDHGATSSGNTGPIGIWNIDSDGPNLRISKPADDGSIFGNDFIVGGARSLFYVAGDFSVTVDFNLHDFPSAPINRLNEAVLALINDDLPGDAKSFSILRFRNGPTNEIETFAIPDDGGGPVIAGDSSTLTEGQFRITRVGDIISGYYADAGSNSFTELGSIPWLTDPLQIQLTAVQGKQLAGISRSQTSIDVSFDNLHIEADEILRPNIGAIGDLYVSSFYTDRVMQFDGQAGSFVANFVDGIANLDPRGLLFTPDGNLLVASPETDSIYEFNGTTGDYIRVFASHADLFEANLMTFGPDGDLYVSNVPSGSPGPGHRIMRFDGVTGNYLGIFATTDLWNPQAMAFLPNGDLIVANSLYDNILRFDDSGSLLGEFVPATSGGLDGPAGMAIGQNGNLFVTSGIDSILEFDGNTGEFVRVFASGEGLSKPRGIVFGPNGNLFVTNDNTDAVTQFDGATGTFIDAFAVGSGLDHPYDLVFKPAAVPEHIVGDYNRNGIVDAADYTIWRDQFGTLVEEGTGPDGNNNGFVDSFDRLIWRESFGRTNIDGGAASVPEPASYLLICSGILVSLLGSYLLPSFTPGATAGLPSSAKWVHAFHPYDFTK